MAIDPRLPSFSNWNLTDHAEPLVRVGIVLAEDGVNALRIDLPDSPYTIECDSGNTRAVRSVTLEVRTLDAGLAVRLNADAPRAAPRMRLTPADAAELAPGCGVGVRGVIAGRGFHWQQRVDQHLPGVIEVLPAVRGLLLINELPLEAYLAGVITAEMSGACPGAFLRAQCIVARSWLLARSEPKHLDQPFDRCNDDCCQRYQGTDDLSPEALAAVRATRGGVLLNPRGDVLDANYAKSCGGVSELPRHVWGHDKPGLTAIVDAPSGDAAHRFLPVSPERLDEFLDGDWLTTTRAWCSPHVIPPDVLPRYLGRVDVQDDYFRWRVQHDAEDLAGLLRDNRPDLRDLATLSNIEVVERGVSGRATVLSVAWSDARGRPHTSRIESEYQIRAALHKRFLYSSAFALRTTRAADGTLTAVTLRGAGWGHGVGLCQIGALGQALAGVDHEAICRHYYPAAQPAVVYD